MHDLDRFEELLKAAPVRVRLGEMRDEAQLRALGPKLHAEVADRALGYDEKRLVRTALRCLDPKLPDLGLVAVAGEGANERIIGFLYATGGQHLYAPVKVATCVVLYVIPELRGGMAAYALIRSFIKRAHAAGASLVTMHVATGVRMSQTHRFLTRLRFSHVGGNYILALRTPDEAAGPVKGD